MTHAEELNDQFVEGVAVVGLSCRFPGINTITEFWRALVEGRELIRELSVSELRRSGIPEELIGRDGYVKAGSVLNDIAGFDADFFGYTPSEAKHMDPQHRVFLELCWEALEGSGLLPQVDRYPTGVFAGAARNMYFRNVVLPSLDQSESLDGSVRGLQADIGNYGDFLTTRVSYKLNLRGPGVNVQTACSTSLTAIHMACMSILSGECDIALAGGVSIAVPQVNGYSYEEGSISSPDGHCRAFDESANGTVFGNGGGVVALKRLDLALADGDVIYAVVKGSAINNDGSQKISYSAPSVDGQSSVISEALAVASIAPETVGYIEAHGTATKVGDPIEVSALRDAFGLDDRGVKSCGLGSVKSNLGHLGAAAGVAGFIKTVLCVYHGKIPPSLHFRRPNPQLAIEASPFFVPTSTVEWPNNYPLRRAGVSSFGIGGTNAHVVLEQLREQPIKPKNERFLKSQAIHELIVVSARSGVALREFLAASAAYFAQGVDNSKLRDIAYSLASSRMHFEIRDFRVCDAAKPLAPQLLAERLPIYAPYDRVVFAFPGQGSQCIGAGASLYQQFPSFAEIVDHTALALSNYTHVDLLKIAFGHSESSEKDLSDTEVTQPALFLVEYSLAKWLINLGLKPDALVGHSIGTYAAAAVSGLMSLECAARLVCVRAACMSNTPEGSMLAVHAPVSALTEFLSLVEVAAINQPDQIVLSGTPSAIAGVRNQLECKGVACAPLKVSRAFHSRLMDGSLTAFGDEVEQAEFGPLHIPIASDATGLWLSADEAHSKEYWVNHIRNPVRFFDALKTAVGDGKTLVIEVGPGNVLSRIVDRSKSHFPSVESIRTMSAPQTECTDLQVVLGIEWKRGSDINWKLFWKGRDAVRCALPTYQFQRKPYWIKSNKAGGGEPKRPPLLDSILEPRPDLIQCVRNFYWAESVVTDEYKKESGGTLVIAPNNELATNVRDCFGAVGVAIILAPGGTSLNAALVESWVSAAEDLIGPVNRVIHLGLADSLSPPLASVGPEFISSVATNSYLDLLEVARELLRLIANLSQIVFVSSNAFVTAHEKISFPWKAMTEALSLTIPVEYPNVETRHIDVDLEEASGTWMLGVLRELSCLATDRTVCYRRGRRLTRTLTALSPVEGSRVGRIKSGGKYLITGGGGEIGRAFVESILNREVSDVKIVLANRSLKTGNSDPNSRSYILGNRVVQEICDVEDIADLEELWLKHNGFDGVIHCAGVPGGQLIVQHNREKALRVLGPKVNGMVNLIEVAKRFPKSWTIMCSSLISTIGGLGQVDYAAANCFLDALAAARSEDGDCDISSINWDVWSGGGMAVGAAIDQSLGGARSIHMESNLFSQRYELPGGGHAFRLKILANRHWMLEEHSLDGVPTTPGTGILALVIEAACYIGGTNKYRIEDLSFVLSLRNSIDIKNGLFLFFDAPIDGRRVFSIRAFSSTGLVWATYAEGELRPSEICAANDSDVLESARTRFDDSFLDGPIGTEELSSGLIRFGARWGNIVSRRRIGNEWLIECSLPQKEFEDDFNEFKVHPALLDTLIGGVLIGRMNGPYLPLSYSNVTIHRALPSHAFAFVVEEESDDEASIRCSAKLFSPDGWLCIEISGYLLRRIDQVPTRVENRVLTLDQSENSLVTTQAIRRDPDAYEIEIAVAATGLNFKEVLQSLGMMPLTKPVGYRFGLECSGVVTRVGKGVTSIRVGQNVMCMATGGFADYVIQREDLCAILPEDVGFAEAATIPVAYTTAYCSLVSLGRLKKGDSILVHSGAGGVGLAAIRIAQHLEAHIYATAGTEEKRSYLRSIGVHNVFDSRNESFEVEIASATKGKGVNVVLNSLGGNLLKASIRCLSSQGRFVEIGRRDILADTNLGMRIFENGLTFSSFNPDVESKEFASEWAVVSALVGQGLFKALPLTEFGADEIPEAFEFMAKGRHIGKIVVVRQPRSVMPPNQISRAIDPDWGRALTGFILDLPESRVAVSRDFDSVMKIDHLESATARLMDSRAITSDSQRIRRSLSSESASLLNPLELAICEVVAEVLEVTHVRLEDSFTSLGGDSLSATQIVARIKKRLGVRVAVSDVLGATSLTLLCQKITDQSTQYTASTQFNVDATANIIEGVL